MYVFLLTKLYVQFDHVNCNNKMEHVFTALPFHPRSIKLWITSLPFFQLPLSETQRYTYLYVTGSDIVKKKSLRTPTRKYIFQSMTVYEFLQIVN
jgi:hypothetical protein